MSRKLSEDLSNPYLFSENQAGQYQYGETATGGKSATGSLQLSDNPARDGKAQTAAGGEDRRGNDHQWGADDGGHLIGARFGGESGEENLTAQNRNLNRSDYKHMENEWAARLEAGDKVFVHIETDNGQRPNAYMGYAIIESADGTRDYDTFHMVNESRAEIAQWESDAEVLEAADTYASVDKNLEQVSEDSFLGTAQDSTEMVSDEDNTYLGEASEESADIGEAISAGVEASADSTLSND